MQRVGPGTDGSGNEAQASRSIPENVDTPSALEVAQALLHDVRQEIVRSDDKASTLLAVVGVGLDAALTVAAHRWWHAGFGQMARSCEWLGIGLSAFGTCCLVSVLVPRYRESEGGRKVAYFADVVRADRRGDLGSAIEAAAENIFQLTIDELRCVSRIALIKYRRIRIAMTSFSVASALVVVALVLHPGRG